MSKIRVSLPDGSEKELEQGANVLELAASIGTGLAKAAIAAKIDGELVDLTAVLPDGAKVEIITEKSPEALDIVRHTTSHLMAQAVKSLFPAAKVTIGPAIENGFYYDFDVEAPFSPEDLENRSKDERAAKANSLERQVLTKDEAIKLFSEMGES
jgi:threonyl-tRNA synthetase